MEDHRLLAAVRSKRVEKIRDARRGSTLGEIVIARPVVVVVDEAAK